MTEKDPTSELAWPICGTSGCIGVRRDGQQGCLAHVGLQVRNGILAALKPGADLDLRGTPMDSELLDQLLAAVRPEAGPVTLRNAAFDRAQFSETADFNGAQFSGDAWFKGAQFSGGARFKGAQFSGAAWFDGAQFSRTAWFDGAQFSRDTWFKGAQFSWDVRFDGVQFSRDTWFNEAQFSWDAWFSRAQFSGAAWFGRAQFSGAARFIGVQFSRDAWFSGAQFSRTAWFIGAQFSGAAEFGEAQFSRDAWFSEAQFKRAGTLGPVLAVGILSFDHAVFEQDITMEAMGGELSCVGTRFAEATTLRLCRAQVVLDGAKFAKPSTVAFATDPFMHYDPVAGGEVETFGGGPVARAGGGLRARPRLLSLRGVDVATLTLSELDLAACLFQGAHHLDQLRIEGAQPFASTPAGWKFGRVGGQGVPVWRWTRRQTLAEEHHWRAGRGLPAAPSGRPHPQLVGWSRPELQAPDWSARQSGRRVQPLQPGRIALLYRALRKAQEDSKDEPGAADFYYGEMEMRRLASATPWGERVILTLYWLVSGYGLRGLRALAWLMVVVVGLAGLLQAVGFNGGDPGFRDALIYAAQSTISIPTGNMALTEHVSWAGEMLRIVLRLTGPVLLGLALLAVRNRVKR
jgi:uncharacterized protein YjbI with pentapeptide repeats